MGMFFYRDEGTADKGQEMTKRWRNVMELKKNRSVMGAEQQQQEDYTKTRQGNVERVFPPGWKTTDDGGKSANETFTGAGIWKRDT